MDRTISEHAAQPEEQAIQPADETMSSKGQPTIHYADDDEVDRAMAGIFQKHDRLLRELAK